MFKKLLNIGKSHHNHPSSTASASEKPTSSSNSMLTVDDLNGSNTSGSIIARNNGTSTPAANITVNGPEVSHFVRTAQNRMSLPIMQHNRMRRQAYNQSQRRSQHHLIANQSMGFIYLQHKGETKQACLPNELTTIDTIRALFVCAFPHYLTMEFMSQPFVKIYIYNPSCNIFYELCDIEDVRHESVLRIHQSDPMSMAMAPMSIQMTGPPISNPNVPHSVSMASMQSHYATLNRITPRPLPPQVPAPPIPQQQPPMQQHLIQPVPSQMLHSTFQQRLTPTQNGNQAQHPHRQSFHHLPQIPPPKPRRMIPANYPMQRIDPSA